MRNNPLVTVICLCYNHADFVIESLESVLNQTHSKVELIIADDFSSDNSVEVIKNWLKHHPQIPFIANETNLGNTKTFNKCLALAKGQYIIDLAADDILMEDCIKNQLEGFENSIYKNVGLVYGNAELITEKGLFIANYFPTDLYGKGIENQPTGDIYINLLNGKTKLCSISALTKRAVFDQLNGYDENLAYEDYDFWLRTARTYDFDFVDKVLIQKRMLDNSLYTIRMEKNNSKACHFNYSTYLIMEKAFVLNQNKAEFLAMLKRIHLEMLVTIKTRHFELLLKYILLEIKVRKKILITLRKG